MGDLILKVTGNRFQEAHKTTYLVGNDITVDWGDGNVEALGTKLDHYYSDGLNEHIITISNVTGLEDSCFLRCTNLISVIIPSTITYFGSYCFQNCTGLKNIVFLGSSAPYAGYKSFDNVPSSCVICVPNAQSTSIYSEEENYPNPNTYHYTLNNILSLNGSLSELGYLMANNLSNMGISNVHGSDGLTSLANQILNIEPSVSGLNLETSLTVQSEAEIEVGESVVISSKLNVFYDDETLVNVDLSGVLIGATVSIKEGNNIVGTGITNSNGIADISVSNLSVGTHNLKAVFSGTENFQECESNTINVNVITLKPTNIEINATKNILSYTDTDSTDITVTVLNKNDIPISGKTVTMGVYMEDDDSLLESLSIVDENDGTYTSTYNSQGVGDVYIKAECGSLVTEIFALQDCRLYDIGASENISKYTTNGTFTYDSTEQAYINSNSSMYIVRETISGDEDFEATMDFKLTSTKYSMYFGATSDLRDNKYDAQGYYYPVSSRMGAWFKANGSTNKPYVSQSYSANVWYTAKVVKQNGTLTAYLLQGDTVLNSKSVSCTDTTDTADFRILPENTIMYFKNIKLKLL